MDKQWINVRDFNAKGDGKTDDTRAVRAALDSLAAAGGGTVHFPPGEYCLDTIDVPADTTLSADAGWSYTDCGHTVLKPARDDQPCLFRVDSKRSTRFVGLSMTGGNRGKGMHGIQAFRPGETGTDSTAGSSCREMGLVIENCSITSFSGSALHFRRVWVWTVRHSLLGNNRGHGIDATDCYDAWIIDTIIAGNDLCGLRSEILAAVTITGSRIEWNHQGGIILGPQYVESVQISNCLFDACFGPAVAIEGRKGMLNAVNGNIFRRNGYQCEDRPDDSCHLRFANQQGLVVSGNTMLASRVDPKVDAANPAVGIRIQSLRDSVVQGNALYHGAMKELISDLGGHQNLVLKDNPGSLQQPGELEL